MAERQRPSVGLLLAAALAVPCIGCFGVTQNPSYFPFYLPTGDIIRTHAKPPGLGYFANFDPHAVRLDVQPLESSGPTRTQFLLIATVSDENGQPRRKRRVEWLLEGVGNVVEVDESGYFAGRGYKVDNKYAVSYTDYLAHTIKAEDGREVCIEPGQTWCVITSAAEGDTSVTVYAPEIANVERHKVFVTRHWCDAEWRFPPPAACPAGTQPVLSTQVLRASDRQPLANYHVRYRLLDGPPAQLLPTRTQEAEVTSDAAGQAKVTLAELSPRPGSNRIAVEVVRLDASGPGVVVGRGETTIEWQAPQVAVTVTAPPTVVVGQDVPVTVTVTNPGQVPTQSVQVRAPIRDGMQYVASDPPASVDGNQLVWQLAGLSGGGSQSLRATFRVPSVGVVTATAAAQTRDGLRAESQATTRVAVAELQARIAGPTAAPLGDPVTLDVSVTNPGTGPAANVKVRAEFVAALEHESRANPLEVAIGTLEAGQTQTVPLSLTPRQAGRPYVRVLATADGNLRAEATHTLSATPRALTFSLSGPPTRYLNRPATWDVRVANAGEIPLAGVQMRVKLPAEVNYQSATGNSRLTGDEVVWSVSDLRPGERRDIQLTATPVRAVPHTSLTGVATAEKVPEQRAESAFEVLGMAALRVEVLPPAGSVAVGGKPVYTIRVLNQGTLAARQVAVTAVLPPPCLRPRFGTGPTVGRVEGGRVSFTPIERVEPGQTVVFRVEAEAVQAGDARVRAELRSDGAATPVVTEEATRITEAATGVGRTAR
jgi:uncharacterized repeat protein (TIGR01451 family)